MGPRLKAGQTLGHRPAGCGREKRETTMTEPKNEGELLLAEGTKVPIIGGKTATLLFSMLSLVKMEQDFGGIGGVQAMLPEDTTNVGALPPDIFTNLTKLLHLGFLHLGWSLEETQSFLLPKHMEEYTEALGRELSFGETAAGPKEPAETSSGDSGTT